MVIDHIEALSKPSRGHASYRDRFFAWVFDSFIFFPFGTLFAFPWSKAMRVLEAAHPDYVERPYLIFLHILTFTFSVSALKALYRAYNLRTPGEKAMGLRLQLVGNSSTKELFWAGFWREFFCSWSLLIFGIPWIFEIARRRTEFFYDRLTSSYMEGQSRSNLDEPLSFFMFPVSRVLLVLFAIVMGFFLSRFASQVTSGEYSLVEDLYNEKQVCDFKELSSVKKVVDIELVKFLKDGKNVDCLDKVKDILMRASSVENQELGLVVGFVMSKDDHSLQDEYKQEICSSSNFKLCAWASHEDFIKFGLEEWAALPQLELTAEFLKLKSLKSDEGDASEIIALYRELMESKSLKPVLQKDYMTFLVSRLGAKGRVPASEDDDGVDEVKLLKSEINGL